MVKILRVCQAQLGKVGMVVAIATVALTVEATAATIAGVYNTGLSDVDDDETGTLDIRFHPCKDEPDETCGTVEAANNPSNPDAPDVLPDGSPLVGFTMIKGLVDKGDGKFRKGKINAIDESFDKGKMVWYDVKIDDEASQLKVKGCVRFICPRTMYWQKISD